MSDYNPPTKDIQEGISQIHYFYRVEMQRAVDNILTHLKSTHEYVFDPEEMTGLIYEAFEYLTEVVEVTPEPRNKRRLIVKVVKEIKPAASSHHKVSHKITVTSGMTVREVPDSARMFGAFDFS